MGLGFSQRRLETRRAEPLIQMPWHLEMSMETVRHVQSNASHRHHLSPSTRTLRFVLATLSPSMAHAGDADLFIATSFKADEQPNQLWLNSGSGSFTASPTSGAPVRNHASYCAAFADIDGDGDLDLYVGTSAPNLDQIWLNSGSGSFTLFTASAKERLTADSSYITTRTVSWADADGDGPPRPNQTLPRPITFLASSPGSDPRTPRRFPPLYAQVMLTCL